MNNQRFNEGRGPGKKGLSCLVILAAIISLSGPLLGNSAVGLYPEDWGDWKYYHNKVFITLLPGTLKSYFPSDFKTKVVYGLDAKGSSTLASLAGEQSLSSFGKGIALGYSIVFKKYIFMNVGLEYFQCDYPDNMVTDNRTVIRAKLPPEQFETEESVGTYRHTGKKINMYSIYLDGGLMLPYIYTILPISFHINFGLSLYDMKFHSDYSDSLVGLPNIEYSIGRIYKQQGSEWSDTQPIVISTGVGLKFYFLKDFALALDYRGYITTYSKTKDVGGGAYIVNSGIETGCLGGRFSGGLSFYF